MHRLLYLHLQDIGESSTFDTQGLSLLRLVLRNTSLVPSRNSSEEGATLVGSSAGRLASQNTAFDLSSFNLTSLVLVSVVNLNSVEGLVSQPVAVLFIDSCPLAELDLSGMAQLQFVMLKNNILPAVGGWEDVFSNLLLVDTHTSARGSWIVKGCYTTGTFAVANCSFYEWAEDDAKFDWWRGLQLIFLIPEAVIHVLDSHI
jgi:hypothetical protein